MSETPIEWTDRDIEAAKAVLAVSGKDEQSLPTLTDEEIVALDGVGRDQLVALPFLEEHQDQIQLAGNVALRSLLVKGLAYPEVVEGEDEPAKLNASEDITGIITLRRTGQRLVAAERTTGNGKYWLYGYVHGDDILEEEVNAVGIHSFSVYPATRFADRLAILADPAEQTTDDGEAVELNQEQFEARAAELLGDTRAITVVTGVGQESESVDNTTFYASTGSVHGLEIRQQDEETLYRIAPVSRDSMISRLQTVISGSGTE